MEENLTSQELIEKREREKTLKLSQQGGEDETEFEIMRLMIRKTGVSAKSVRHWMIMRECAVTSALLWRQRLFVPTARCIATSPRCASASKK